MVVLFELKMPRNAAAQRKREREKPAPINAPVEAEHLAPVHPDAFPHGIAALHGGIEDRHLGRTGERTTAKQRCFRPRARVEVLQTYNSSLLIIGKAPHSTPPLPRPDEICLLILESTRWPSRRKTAPYPDLEQHTLAMSRGTSPPPTHTSTSSFGAAAPFAFSSRAALFSTACRGRGTCFGKSKGMRRRTAMPQSSLFVSSSRDRH